MNHHFDYWGQLSMRFLAFEGMPVCDPQHAPSLNLECIGSMDLRLRLLQEEEPVASDVDIAIRAWPDDPEPWTRLSDLGLYFLRLRVESSLEFVSMVIGGLDYDGKQMFKSPDDIPPIDFARFLLTEWWMSAGREIAAKNLILKLHDANTKRRAKPSN